MSEYEGKVPRKRVNVDLIDVLYYEATGETLSSEERYKLKLPPNKNKVLDKNIKEEIKMSELEEKAQDKRTKDVIRNELNYSLLISLEEGGFTGATFNNAILRNNYVNIVSHLNTAIKLARELILLKDE